MRKSRMEAILAGEKKDMATREVERKTPREGCNAGLAEIKIMVGLYNMVTMTA